MLCALERIISFFPSIQRSKPTCAFVAMRAMRAGVESSMLAVTRSTREPSRLTDPAGTCMFVCTSMRASVCVPVCICACARVCMSVCVLPMSARTYML
jgi:hypothetical protein